MSSQKKPQQSRFSVKICALLLGLCLTAGIGAGAASAEETVPNKLQNGSFEEEQTWTGSYKQPNQKDVPSWNTTATDGKIELFQENTGVYIKNVTLAPTDGSIAAELNEMIDNAVVMNSIAANCEQADRDMVAAVNDSIEQLRASASISEKYAASERLHQAVENLYSNVSNLTLSDTDASDFRYKYKNFDSALLRISHDPYNENVMAFNKAKKGFPAGVICAVRGIDDADLFG